MNNSSPAEYIAHRDWADRASRLSTRLAGAGSILLLLSIGASKAGQNIGGAIILLALLMAGPATWRALLHERLVWATMAWIAVIILSTVYAHLLIGIPIQDQTTQLWRFSRLFLIPLLAWGVLASGLGAFRAFCVLFTGIILAVFYHTAAAGWPTALDVSGRIDISGEGVQFYALLCATALLGSAIFATRVPRAASRQSKLLQYGFWGLLALTALHGLLISQGRGAMLALAVVFPVLVIWRLVRHLRQGRRLSLGTGSALVVGALCAITALYASGAVQHSVDRLHRDYQALMDGRDPDTGLFAETSMGQRMNQWQVAVTAIGEHIVMGYGADGSRHVRATADLPARTASTAPHHFHNIYLDVLVRFGLLGALVMGWFWYEVIRAVFRGREPDTPNPSAEFALLGLLAFFIAGITQTYWTSQVTWFYLAAITAPACILARTSARAS